ncbi:hypothetical protein HK103_002644 [Boothiomyces macroporosus]|uniref:Signal recognition particle, SRP19 subunit n=1 Tax=Boothiomyces macroporosus TaxID=261099 RepID=A0AAD5UML4_9FUNG|nr:hypothetical protein HK103_002644 [Boothiomyces macroporosus]
MADDEFDVDNMDFDLPPEDPIPLSTPLGALGQGLGGPMGMPGLGAGLPQGFGMPGMAQGMPVMAPPNAVEMQKQQELIKDWVAVYPVYINCEKSISQGRRIPSGFAVKDPAAIYMGQAAKLLGYDVALELNKRHPRDPFTFGRLRIKFKNDDGAPFISDITNKRELLIRIAEKIPEALEKMDDPEGKNKSFADSSRSVLPPRPQPQEQPTPSIEQAPPAQPVPASLTNKKKNKKKGRK